MSKREPWDDIADTPDSTMADKYGLARFTGLTLKDIDAAVRDGLPTHGERRKGAPLQFSVPECVQWLLARNDDPLASAKRRQAEAVARKRESEAARIDGTFVEMEIVTAAIKDNVARFQSELESIPAKCPPDSRDLVRIEINAAVNRLATGLSL